MIGLRFLESSLPRNIHDNDENFHESCRALPLSLSRSAPTQISYLIAKARLAFGFARILDEVNRTALPLWERVLELDRELRQIYDDVPDHYKLGQLSGEDPLVLISARFVLLSIHHKSLCVLHSRFLDRVKSDGRFEYSRRVCLTSAMSILRFQAIQDQEIPVNGQLRSLTNYQTSLAIHDYLLAATIVTADLYANNSSADPPATKWSDGIPTRLEMIRALSVAADIFRRSQKWSVEAQKAANVLEVIVKRFEAGSVRDGWAGRARHHLPQSNVLTPESSPRHSTTSSDMHPHTYYSTFPMNREITDDRERVRDSLGQHAMATPSTSSQDQTWLDRTEHSTRQLGQSGVSNITAWPAHSANLRNRQGPPEDQSLATLELNGWNDPHSLVVSVLYHFDIYSQLTKAIGPNTGWYDWFREVGGEVAVVPHGTIAVRSDVIIVDDVFSTPRRVSHGLKPLSTR
jgi:hypothetical protein